MCTNSPQVRLSWKDLINLKGANPRGSLDRRDANVVAKCLPAPIISAVISFLLRGLQYYENCIMLKVGHAFCNN